MVEKIPRYDWPRYIDKAIEDITKQGYTVQSIDAFAHYRFDGEWDSSTWLILAGHDNDTVMHYITMEGDNEWTHREEHSERGVTA